MYKLGNHSVKELVGVNSALVAVVERAIELTSQDFTVHDGMRTVEEQRILVAKGASQTMNSKHLTGNAVDLVPYINGKLRWEWDPIYVICLAVRKAAREQGVAIRWGGAWNINLTESTDLPENLVKVYVTSRKAKGKRAFTDGAHWELLDT